MAKQPLSSVSPNVSLDIEAPEVQTPAATYGANTGVSAHLQTYFPTPSQLQARTSDVSDHHISFLPMDHLHSVNHSLPDPGGGVLNLTTSSPYSESPNQYDLPRVIPTPAGGLNQLAEKNPEGLGQDVHGNGRTKEVKIPQRSNLKILWIK